ncbi:hypothetical protein EI94DRAFT_851280 [Lactarius quietus]|nr:hypothetical protein EI94DRAFT_851280 [Lactarius quietus]
MSDDSAKLRRSFKLRCTHSDLDSEQKSFGCQGDREIWNTTEWTTRTSRSLDTYSKPTLTTVPPENEEKRLPFMIAVPGMLAQDLPIRQPFSRRTNLRICAFRCWPWKARNVLPNSTSTISEVEMLRVGPAEPLRVLGWWLLRVMIDDHAYRCLGLIKGDNPGHNTFLFR